MKDLNLTKQFVDNFKNINNKTSIICNEHEYTYKELYENIHRFTSILKDKNIKQKIVYINSDYSFNSISVFFALSILENIIVPVVSDNKTELNKKKEIITPNYIIRFESFEKFEFEKSENHQKNNYKIITELIDNHNPGLVLFSSGTTGKPKAMVHDLNNLIKNFIDKKHTNLTFILLLLFDHIGGLNTLFNSLSMGATIVIPSKKTPENVSFLIDKYNINILPSSPTFLNLILIGEFHIKYSLESLRLVTYGTERMPESLLQKLKKIFPRTKFLQTFGTSETGIASTASENSDSTFFKINDNNQEFKIVENELWLKSKTQIKGYINNSNDNFTNDGWFKTGDLVEQKNGYIRIIGRKNEIINVGGEKVMASEIESTILELEDILDCTVKGESNPITGQIVIAEIITDSVDHINLKKEIKKHCKNNLDSYKVPVKIKFKNEITYSDRFKKK